jgi:CRP/FNR family transcriptional regulator, cyclic AMP receptor protein
MLDADTARNLVSTKGWLAGRPKVFRDRLLGLSRILRFSRGQTIYSAGDPPGGLYGLIAGALRIELTVHGIGSQVAFVAQPGFWIGAASAIRREQRELTLISANPSELFYLPMSGFEVLASDAENMRQFAILTAENNSLVLAAARDLMNSDVSARIASRLLAIFGPVDGVADDGTPPPIAITQAELAMICNVSRKTINHELAKLKDGGLVSLAYGRLTLTDTKGLRRLAGV